MAASKSSQRQRYVREAESLGGGGKQTTEGVLVGECSAERVK